MPDLYTHDHFGRDFLELLPEEEQEIIWMNRTAYDMGLQGPDFLFYYRPAVPNHLNSYGNQLHTISGKRLFRRFARVMRRDPSDVKLAYIYGMLCHYALDSNLHPIVNACRDEGVYSHALIETSLDRSFLIDDGLDPLHTPLGRNLKAESFSQAEEEIAQFYPHLTPKQITESFETLISLQALFLMNSDAARKSLDLLLHLYGRHRASIMGHIMPKEDIPGLAPVITDLKKAYRRTLSLLPYMKEDLLSYISYGTELPDTFEKDFGGLIH